MGFKRVLLPRLRMPDRFGKINTKDNRYKLLMFVHKVFDKPKMAAKYKELILSMPDKTNRSLGKARKKRLAAISYASYEHLYYWMVEKYGYTGPFPKREIAEYTPSRQVPDEDHLFKSKEFLENNKKVLDEIRLW